MNSLPFGFYAFYIFIIGLCIGSFLNVAILRGLSGENMVIARSKCPKCGNQLKWYMNIPLLSYIFLRGKCAFCHEKISIQYPTVELICGLLYLYSFFQFRLTLKTLYVCIILSVFILLAATDFKEKVILDIHAYILAGLGIICSFTNTFNISILNSIISGLVGFLAFELLARIGKHYTGIRMFGEGDSLIAIGLGTIFGIKTFFIIVCLSFLIQSVSAIPILILNAIKNKNIKLSISYSLVLFSLIAVFSVNYFKILDNEIYYLAFIIVISAMLFWCLKNIVREIRQKKLKVIGNTDDEKYENSPYFTMPFGPALIFGATLTIFYLPQIKAVINSYFN